MTSERQPAERGLFERIQPHLRDMAPYTPVEPPDVLAARLGLPVERIVKLDGNENPYGPSPKARDALARYRWHNIYPDPAQSRLRDALARYAGVPAEWITAGAGSDELIDLLVRMFLAPGDSLITFPPTFGMYAFSAHVQGGEVIELPRRDDFTLDLSGLDEAAGRAKAAFVVSPNNPTGNLLPEDDLRRLLDTGLPVVVDEAYAEFAGESFIPLVAEHPNLVVLRTLSKWAGLAGLRVGFMVARPEVIEVALKVKQPYSVSVAAEAAALASLDDVDALMTNVAKMVDERERLVHALRAFECFEVYPSSANFVLFRLDGMDAKSVRDELRARGILVRYFETALLRDCLRVSVGKPEHTDALLDALRAIIGDRGRGENAAS